MSKIPFVLGCPKCKKDFMHVLDYYGIWDGDTVRFQCSECSTMLKGEVSISYNIINVEELG